LAYLLASLTNVFATFAYPLADVLTPLAYILGSVLPAFAEALTHTPACRDEFTLLHLVADSLATRPNRLAGDLKIAAFRLRSHRLHNVAAIACGSARHQA
jgi:hypothetical protein